MNSQRVMNAAIDCIFRFRASRFPLKHVGNDIIVLRKLNSSERKVFLDLIFCFSKEVNLLDRFIDENVYFSSAMSRQQKDVLILQVLSYTFSVFSVSQETAKLYKDYEQWLISLGDERYIVALGALIGGLIKTDYPENAYEIAKGLFRRPAKYLAVDRRFVTVADVCNSLKDLGIDYFHHQISPNAIGTYQNIDIRSLPKEISPHVWFMDAGSQIIAELICAKSSETVLDLCTGEGGKAYYITMRDCAYVAIDIDNIRLKRAQKRLKHRFIKFICADGRFTPCAKESFDWILLDAPCSGIGVLRRHPDLIHRLTQENIDNYIELQRQLLNSAINLLKKDGKLIYATCSLLRAENEQQIEHLRENNKIIPIKLSDLVDANLIFNKNEINSNCFTLYPHIHNCDGFYFASLKKPKE